MHTQSAWSVITFHTIVALDTCFEHTQRLFFPTKRRRSYNIPLPPGLVMGWNTAIITSLDSHPGFNKFTKARFTKTKKTLIRRHWQAVFWLIMPEKWHKGICNNTMLGIITLSLIRCRERQPVYRFNPLIYTLFFSVSPRIPPWTSLMDPINKIDCETACVFLLLIINADEKC